MSKVQSSGLLPVHLFTNKCSYFIANTIPLRAKLRYIYFLVQACKYVQIYPNISPFSKGFSEVANQMAKVEPISTVLLSYSFQSYPTSLLEAFPPPLVTNY